MALHPTLCRLGGAVLLGFFALAAQAEVPSPRALLEQMARQPANLNYQGSFTYEYGSVLETFRVLHWVEDGVQYERLRHLSGPEQEIVRQGQAVDCWSTGSMLLQDRVRRMDGRLSDLEQFYQFDVVGLDRVAARYAVVLRVVPRDPYRYGYLLSIDPQTGLLLKSLLLDEQEQLLERFQFVELQLNPDVQDLPLDPVAHRHRVANPHLSGCNQAETGEPGRWQLAWVPSGFTFSGQQQVRDGVDMLMYTDGLAAFSVFLEPASGPVFIQGHAQRGATNIYMGLVSRGEREYRATVVGELPVLAAERIAQNISARPANGQAPGDGQEPPDDR